jgi:type IV secretory pathway TraG/TraD family ATPase VirD4
VVLDTCDTHVILSGVKDPQTLETASKLCGHASYREGGREHDSRHEVMTPDMIRQLPDWRALVIRGGLAPVIARLPMCWEDRDYKRARRTGAAQAQIAPVAARGTLGVQSAEELAALPEPQAVTAPTLVYDNGELVPEEPEHAFPWGGAR